MAQFIAYIERVGITYAEVCEIPELTVQVLARLAKVDESIVREWIDEEDGK